MNRPRALIALALVAASGFGLAGCSPSPEQQQAASDCNQARDDLSNATETFQGITSDPEVSRALQAKAEDIGQSGTDAQAEIHSAAEAQFDDSVPECSGGTDQLNSTTEDLQNRKSSVQQRSETIRVKARAVASDYSYNFTSHVATGNGKAIAAWKYARTLTPSDTNTPGTPAAAYNTAMSSPAVTEAKANLKTAITAWNEAQQKTGWDLPDSAQTKQLIDSIDSTFRGLVGSYYDHLDWVAANPFSTADQEQVVKQGVLDSYRRAPDSTQPAKME